VPHGEDDAVVYLAMDDFYRAASKALRIDLITVRSITNETLAGSALAAPSAGFGYFEQYPNFATKTAVLLQAVAVLHHMRGLDPVREGVLGSTGITRTTTYRQRNSKRCPHSYPRDSPACSLCRHPSRHRDGPRIYDR
jgi:hypothetical protein